MRKWIFTVLFFGVMGSMSGCSGPNSPYVSFASAHDVDGSYDTRSLTFSIIVSPAVGAAGTKAQLPASGGTLTVKLVPYSQVPGTRWEKDARLRRIDVTPELWKQAVVILERPSGTIPPGYPDAKPGVYLTSQQAPIVQNITDNTIELQLTKEQLQMFMDPNKPTVPDFWIFVKLPGDHWADDVVVDIVS